MQTTQVDDSTFFDMFNITPQTNAAGGDNQQVNQENAFKLSENTDSNIFGNPQETPEEKLTRETLEALKTSEGGEGNEEEENSSELFQHDEDIQRAGRRPKYNFTDASGYFEDRIKAGKFVAVNEVGTDGVEKPFIPKTPEEFDEFIDINLNHKFEEKAKQIEQGWLNAKSPAFQYLAEFADKISDVSELLPFIQGIQKIDSVSSVNEAENEGAEFIYRTWLTDRGEPKEVIEKQIELAKTSNQLLDLAKSYKPLLVEREQRTLADLNKRAEENDLRISKQIYENEQKAILAIDAPIFGNQKLKDDEKGIIYSMIGRPIKELGGYAIYNEIDKLFANKDFESLREVALLLGKKDSYLKYASVPVAKNVAAGAMRTLKIATEANKSGTGESAEPNQNFQQSTIRRQATHNQGFSRR